MRIDWWTLALQTINLVVLVWLLARFLLKPLAAIVAERQAAARHLLDEADTLRATAEAERQAISHDRETIAAERASVLAAAEAEANRQRQSVLEAAALEADRIRADAKSEAVRILAGADRQINARSTALAVDISRRLLARVPRIDAPAAWLPGLVASLAALPEATRARIAAGPVRLTCAATVESAEAENCRAALGQVLGTPLDLTIAVDPALLAGLELSTVETVVHNNLRVDLERIAATLASDDRA